MRVYRGGCIRIQRGYIPYSHFLSVCLFVCLSVVFKTLVLSRRYLSLYRRYLNCIFCLEGTYFSSLHPINIDALCLKYLAILAAWFCRPRGTARSCPFSSSAAGCAKARLCPRRSTAAS